MTLIKVNFRPASIDGAKGTVFYKVTKGCDERSYMTDYHVLNQEWDYKEATFILNGDDRHVATLMSYRRQMRSETDRLRMICEGWRIRNIDFNADDVVREFRRQAEQRSFFNFLRGLISGFKHAGKRRTSETYASALASFMKFRGGRDIALDIIDADVMRSYQAYLKQFGCTMNTISFYMRILRAAYNRAVERGLTCQRNPFHGVYTGVDKTPKRAVELDVVRRLKQLDLSDRPSLGFAKDMFLFSFYTRGMSFIDMAYLTKADLHDGYITYFRHKTGQRLKIKFEKDIMDIIAKYQVNDSYYLLPIITEGGKDDRTQYRSRQRSVNRALERIGRELDLGTPLTMYVARHTWASVAKSQNVPLSVISQSLGHESESTTKIYLAALDNNIIDKANRKILDLL